MVTETNKVITVRKCHDALRVDLGHWEDVLEYVTDTVTKLGSEVVHDEMWVCLTNWVDFVFKIVTKDHVVETEVGGWSVRHVTDYQTIGFTSSLMNHDQVSEVVSLADLNQVFEHVATSVYASSVGNDQLHLLLESHKSLTWVTTRCDQKLWVSELGLLILIIDV